MGKSETPRTDAVKFKIIPDIDMDAEVVPVIHMELMEKQLTAAKAANEELKRKVAEAVWGNPNNCTYCDTKQKIRELGITPDLLK